MAKKYIPGETKAQRKARKAIEKTNQDCNAVFEAATKIAESPRLCKQTL